MNSFNKTHFSFGNELHYVPSKPALRPGSEDALKLPSRIGDERIPYKPPSNGCVGILKDRSPHARLD